MDAVVHMPSTRSLYDEGRVRSITVVVLLCVLAGCSSPKDAADRAVSRAKATVSGRLAGRPMASFVVPRLGIGTGSLADYRGRPVLANLWATWCPPCRREMPALEQLWRTYRARGFVVVGIDEGEPRSAVAGWVRSIGITYAILLDQNMQYATELSVLGFPTSVFVRRDGTVDAVATGELDYTQMKMRAEHVLSE